MHPDLFETEDSKRSFHLPLELINFLNKINDNITDVKERLIRIEAQDYGHSIRNLAESLASEKETRERAFETERKERIELEKRINILTTKVAPILALGTLAFGGVIDFILRSI